MQEMRVVHLYSCPRYGQVVLEDTHGMVKLYIRMRPLMAHWLAHELKECRCPAISMYRLLQELLGKLGGALRLAVIDASEENTPLGLLIIRHGGEEVHQSCHPADAVALSEPTQTILHMLDYVAVDYPESVQDGAVLDQAEYGEQLEFAHQAQSMLTQLP